MSNISDMMKEGYNVAVSLNLQQKGSKLSSCVREEIQNTERYSYDSIGPTEAQQVSTRNGDTPLVTTTFNRRVINLTTWDWGDLIDKTDQLKFLTDPTSAYALNASYALGRAKDKAIILSALGDAYTGSKGETTVAFPDTQKIVVDFEETAGVETGLTIAKLRQARQMLDDADVDDAEDQYCIVTAKQVSDLLKTTEVTSEDYNTVKALVDGKINTFMGFTFKRVSSALLPKTENIREIFCYTKSGLLLATAGDITTDISVRADKRMATQVYASLSCGASRMDEKKVVSISCAEEPKVEE